jgi:hypothetical protein
VLQVRVDRAGKVGLSAAALLEHHVRDHRGIQGVGGARLPCPLQAGRFAPAGVTTAPLEPGQRCPEKRVVELACQVQAYPQETCLLRRRDQRKFLDEPGAVRTQVVYLLAADNSPSRESSTMPPLHHRVRGHCHDSTPRLLSAHGLGTPVAVCHVVSSMAKPQWGSSTAVRHAQHVATHTRQGTETVCRVVYLHAADNSIGPRIRYNPPVSPPSEGVVS